MASGLSPDSNDPKPCNAKSDGLPLILGVAGTISNGRNANQCSPKRLQPFKTS